LSIYLHVFIENTTDMMLSKKHLEKLQTKVAFLQMKQMTNFFIQCHKF